MRALLTTALKQLVPRILYPSSLLRRSVQRKSSSIVMAGPFRGMKYIGYSTFGAYIPKLIGTYELELADVIERALRRMPGHIIDIGGAEGYYAVGLLTRLPDARVTVFEQAEAGRNAMVELAQMNGVSARLDVRDRCSPASLNARLAETNASLVIVDVEGYETELLDVTVCPRLKDADLLVEVHDFKVQGCSDLICSRFSDTHRVTVIPQRPRVLSEYPISGAFVSLFPRAVIKYALNEFRQRDNWWVWLERKSLPALNS